MWLCVERRRGGVKMGYVVATVFGVISGLLFYSAIVTNYEKYKRRLEEKNGNANNSI